MTLKKILFNIGIIVFLLSTNKIFAQSDVWFVGNNISIDFSSGTAVVGNGIAIGGDLTESSTAITDSNGDLLFAVVGDKIYDGGENSVMNLPANTWDVSNGTMVVPVPGTSDEYYLTVLREGGSSSTTPMAQYYHVVTSGSGSGNLTITGPTDLETNLTQSQTSVPKINPDGTVSDDYWWISHEMCNNNFVLYSITNAGISPSSTESAGPSFDCISAPPDPKFDAIGTLKFNGCFTQMSYVMGDKVMLFDFDPQTGAVTHLETVTTGLPSAYSMEFSPDGKYAYVLTGQDSNNPGKIYRLDVTPTGFGPPFFIGSTGGMRGGHLQLGPDGNIYYSIPEAYGNAAKGKIGRITDPNVGGVLDNNWYSATGATFGSSDEDQWVNMDMPTFMKSLVVPLPKLLLDGVELSQTQVCEGDEVDFELEVQGSVATSVDWIAVGANPGIQSGGSTYTETMSNVGTTNITAKVTDECGREKEVDFEVITHQIQIPSATIDYTTCPNPVLTGTGSLSGNYKWYDADPTGSSANLLGIGSTFKGQANTTYWVAPAGNVTTTSIEDTRQNANYGIGSGNGTLTVANGVATINSCEVLMYGWSGNFTGDLTVELRDASNNVVGTPVTTTFNQPASELNVVLNPSDWTIAAGTYTIVRTSKPANANIGALDVSNFSESDISISGGTVGKFDITHALEGEEVRCFEPTEIEVGSCCASPSDDPFIDVTSSKLEVCDPNTGEVISISGLTDGLDFKWQESLDGTTFTDITGETGVVSGGQLTLSNLSTDKQWYRYVLAETGNLEKTCVKTSDSVQFIVNPMPKVDSIGRTPFKTIYCEGEAYELEAHADESVGYPATYKWKLEGSGTDTIFEGITTSGTHDYRVVIDSKGCLDSMDIAIDVESIELADVTDVQGPYCINDVSSIISYESGTTVSGFWSVQTTDNATIDASSGELTFVDSGFVRVYYQTPGACFGIDSVDISIEPGMEVGFETADTNFCKVDAIFPLRLTASSNSGGIWSTWDVGNNTNIAASASGSFDASGLEPGDYIVKYAVNGFSAACSDSDSITVTINPLDTAFITNPPSLCGSDNPYQLTLDLGYTISGDWTDSTGSNGYVTSGGLFDPAGLNDGKVMVVFTTDGLCPGGDTAYVTVTSQINYDLPDGNQTFCLNNDPDILSINVNTGGGKFWTTSEEGISADSLFVVFSLYTTGGQIDSLYYGKSGQCGDTVGVELTLLDIDTAAIDSFPSVCLDTDPFAWTYSSETTLGGTWSGNGIDPTTGIFTPVLAGPGIHTISYTTLGGCPTSDQVDIVVRPRAIVTLDSLALAFCGTASAQSTTANIYLGIGRWEKSGSWPTDWDAGLSYDNDSTLNFDPNLVTSNTDSIFYMIDESPFVCGDTTTLRIGISAMETADIDSVLAVCSAGGAFDFTVQGTQGGTWSGIGVTDGAQGTFDPVIAGVGVHMIRYQSPGVCFVWDSLTITVILQETLTLTGDQTYCGNALPGDIFADKTGGVFFGGWNAAALTTVDDSTRTFNPVLSGGTGIDSVMYGISGQCGDTTALVITIDTVDIPDIDGADESAFCQTDAAATVSLMVVSTPGGTWEDFGGGNSIITPTGLFDPVIGQGTYQVVYTTPGACFTKDTHEISVVGQIIVDIDPAAIPVEYCNDHGEFDLTPFLLPTTSSNTGGWQITPKVIGGINDNNKLVPSALAAGVYSLKYALGKPDGNCRDSDSVAITILPILDPTITPPSPGTVCVSLGNLQFVNTGDAGGVWSVDNGGTIDAVTGNMTLTSAGTFNITYSLGTVCPIDSTVTLVVEEPKDPTITNPGQLCAYDESFTMLGVDAGGTWSGIGVVNGDEFDPTVNGNTGGTITITYAFTGVCPIDDTEDFIVDPVLDPTIDNKPSADVCIADGNYTFTTSGDANGAWSSNNGGVIDPISGDMNLITTGGGIFNAIYTHGGCFIADTVDIKITTPGEPNVTPIGPFCENLPIQSQITLPPTGGGTWSSTPLGGAIDPLTGDFDPTAAGPGAHLIRYDLPGTCPAWDTTTVIISDLPDWDIEIPNSQGCEPFTTAMIVNSQGSLPAQSFWGLTDGSTHQLIGSTDSLTHILTNNGNYSIGTAVVFENGCEDSLYRSNAITVNPVPVANFDWGPKNTTVLEPFIQFEDLSIDADADGYFWDLGRRSGVESPSPATSINIEPFVTYPDPDSSSYWVTLTVDNNGCSDSITKRIWILDNFSVYVPNAFTPDGDGLNDAFFPNGKNHDNIEGASQYEFLIFNRWGQLVWESAIPYQPWDGTNVKTNSKVQQDVYVWKLNVWDNIESVLKTYYGRVSLLR